MNWVMQWGMTACADVINTYYGYGDIPLGLIRDGIKNLRENT